MRAISYFAYGSNMLTERLRARVPSARPIGPGWARGWSLGFGKRSLDLSGKATIAPEAATRLDGVLFEIAAPEIGILDRFEGPGYTRESIDVRTPGGETVTAEVYVGRPDHLDPGLLPYDWYLGLILAGARWHGLPAPHLARLAETPAIPDPNPSRPTRLEALRLLAGPSSRA
jgi:hypothetical protein